MNDLVTYHADAGVCTVTLNRPDVLNALNRPLVTALRDAFERASEDRAVRAVVVTGAGRGFCAGADVRALNEGGDPVAALRDFFHPLVLALRNMPKPVIVAVNGAAAGAGMSLALAGDIVLAARSATFLQAFTKIGLIPDAGSTYFLPRQAGEMRARALAILGEKIDASEAERMGLVWKVFDDDALTAESMKLAHHLASMPTTAYALTKAALNVSLDQDLAHQLELEASLQARAYRTDDAREALSAFTQRRTPAFKGS
ncbi:enoyl-CoA hydratase-related protein [Caballeronia cordobensis]|uniref:enoyl-CoA hydratase-related protein n=1 Tax=Caballeronia cordobensis TaxID=1353886 RepID=UPI00045F0927|nr:enoyl-coA hydratase [Burkholderia sp. RPE67]